MLENIDEFVTMKFREFINFIIISLDRDKYLAVTDDEVVVKGISHKYPELDKAYFLFRDLNFYNKKVLFSQMNKIKDFVLENTDKKFFMIPRDDKFAVVTLRHGTMLVQNSTLFSISDIDRMKYYEFYFKQFLDSVFLEFY